MALPRSREDLIDWIKSELGEPVIRVNLAPIQYDHCIDDAMQYWREYHEASTERTYIKHIVTEDDVTNGFLTLSEDVQSVLKVLDPNTLASTSSIGGEILFDFDYYLNNAAVWDVMRGFGGVSSFVITKQYLADLDAAISPAPSFRFKTNSSKLFIDDTATRTFIKNKIILIECHRYIDADAYSKVWSDRWLRVLAIAYCKRQWGRNLSKFSGVTLPSGITLNGQAILDEALAEIREIEQDIIEHGEPLGIIIK